jgi:hypothetical protein
LANGAALVLSATAFRRRSISAGTGSKCCCPPRWRSRQLQLGMDSGLAEGNDRVGGMKTCSRRTG